MRARRTAAVLAGRPARGRSSAASPASAWPPSGRGLRSAPAGHARRTGRGPRRPALPPALHRRPTPVAGPAATAVLPRRPARARPSSPRSASAPSTSCGAGTDGRDYIGTAGHCLLEGTDLRQVVFPPGHGARGPRRRRPPDRRVRLRRPRRRSATSPSSGSTRAWPPAPRSAASAAPPASTPAPSPPLTPLQHVGRGSLTGSLVPARTQLAVDGERHPGRSPAWAWRRPATRAAPSSALDGRAVGVVVATGPVAAPRRRTGLFVFSVAHRPRDGTGGDGHGRRLRPGHRAHRSTGAAAGPVTARSQRVPYRGAHARGARSSSSGAARPATRPPPPPPASAPRSPSSSGTSSAAPPTCGTASRPRP